MCGRFTLSLDPAQLREAFPWLFIPEDLKPRYNIAPSQPVAVVTNTSPDKVTFFSWGLVPSWAKDPSMGSRLINARAETLSEKPAFRTSYRRKRCLILADGFYEWKLDSTGKSKSPFYIYLQTRKPFTFAGLWDIWTHSDGSFLPSCTIITTTPNELIQSIHNRMPVILPESAYQSWLDPDMQDTQWLSHLLTPYPALEMSAHAVSRYVNAPQNDTLECIQPVSNS